MWLSMNSLRMKRDDMIRQLINEPADQVSNHLLFWGGELRAEKENSFQEMISDRQSLNHS